MGREATSCKCFEVANRVSFASTDLWIETELPLFTIKIWRKPPSEWLRTYFKARKMANIENNTSGQLSKGGQDQW